MTLFALPSITPRADFAFAWGQSLPFRGMVLSIGFRVFLLGAAQSTSRADHEQQGIEGGGAG